MIFFRFFTALACLSLLIFTTESQFTALYSICPNTSTYTSNSLFQINLNALLLSLPSYQAPNNTLYNKPYNATLKNVLHDASYNATPNYSLHNVTNPDFVLYDGFLYATAGLELTDKVYIQSLCRGDVTASKCQDCVNFATSEITKFCPIEKEAIVWYDECLLRYSNRSFFSIADTSPWVFMWNSGNTTDRDKFNQVLAATMNDTATQASNSPKRFATKEANFTKFQTLYSLVQCTPDLTSLDCNSCLRQAIAYLPTCCDGKQGGRVLYPSCNIRYETYPFYEETLTAAPEPPLPVVVPPPPSRSVEAPKGKSQLSSVIIIAIVAPIAASMLLLTTGYCFLTRRARKKNNAIREETDYVGVNDITTLEALQFDFGTIEATTNKFSDDYKLGEGGFGEVYKGTLPNGQQIAVKRLSKSSEQGAEEFKNEVVLVAKLQHRNLVRLLGFCLEGEEKILIYELLPNKSLDYFLFDPEKQGQLSWSRRYKIIEGIARGILYLHEDSHLKIIHRDLKASNILLDGDMIPKISDFGMARIFGVNQTQENTSTIVGTYGYMSPEYAMHGHFSVKSDIYSFGVLILEIISGKKNICFYQTDGDEHLTTYAWKHWRDGTPLELLDPTLRDSYSRNEVIRCVHIGLLCVQEDPAERPTMATIVFMLNTDSVTVPLPQQPALFLRIGAESNMPTKEAGKSMPW